MSQSATSAMRTGHSLVLDAVKLIDVHDGQELLATAAGGEFADNFDLEGAQHFS